MSTIKDKIFGSIKPIFNDQINEIIRNERSKEKELIQNSINERNKHFKYVELESFIGKPVICVSNEWETPIIGFGKSINFVTAALDPILNVKNFIDNITYSVPGHIFHYTEQRFNVLFKLDPFELCSFIYGKYSDEEFNKKKYTQILSKEEVIKLLKQNGFYEKL